MDLSLGHLFLTGGWVMWPLGIFSVLTWAIVLERAFVYLSLKPKLNQLSQSLIQTLKSGDLQAARQICHTQKPYVSDLFLSAIDTKQKRETAERVTERNRLRLMAYFKKHLWILGTIGSASPFVGLLGTVVGIVRAFADMSAKGSGGFAVVAGGISEALVATGAGLIVAIVALLTYNIFVNAANQTLSSLKLTLDEILDESFQVKTAAS
jgi:biopolymer transport protein ExbB